MKRALLSIIITTLGSTLSATNFYVSYISGNDLNAGTFLSPWKTLTKVNATGFVPGDSIFFARNESWNNQLVVSSSGSNGDPVFYGAYGSGNRPLINGFGFSKTIDIQEKEYITISSLEVTSGDHCIFMNSLTTFGLITLDDLYVHSPETNNCISIKDRANVTITDSEMHDAGSGNGISAYESTGFSSGWASLKCHNITVTGCHIYNNHRNGIYIVGHNALITDNHIDNNGAFGLVPALHNIYLVGDSATVENNVLTSSGGGNGFRYEGSNLTIRYNFIKNNFKHGISLSNDFIHTMSDNHISYNIIIGEGSGYGILVFAQSSAGIFEGVEIYNNSIYATTTDFFGFGLFNGTGLIIKNNIIDVQDRTLRISPLCASDLNSDYNCFNSARVDGVHMYNPATASFISLSNWQTSDNDLNSIETDPQFSFSPPDTTLDLKLTGLSPCINVGMPIGAISDFFNVSLVGLPDLGACEFDLTTSINPKAEKTGFLLYPNPSENHITLEIADFENFEYLNVTSLLGEKMSMQKVTSKTNIVNVASLTNGAYILTIKGRSGITESILFVKE